MSSNSSTRDSFASFVAKWIGDAAGNESDRKAFIESMTARLAAGQREYGDASFARPTADLVEEIGQECEDIAGWSYIAWTEADDDLRFELEQFAKAGFELWQRKQALLRKINNA